MDANQPQSPLSTTISTLNTLMLAAGSIVAVIGGVPVLVLEGIHVAQALIPVAESFILNLGSKNVTIDVSQANDPHAIVAALQKSVADGWPVLSFTAIPPTA